MVEDSLCQDIMGAFETTGYEFFDREQRPSFNELNISQLYNKKQKPWDKLQEKIMIVSSMQLSCIWMNLIWDQTFLKYAFEEFRIKMYRNNEYDEFKDHVDVGNYNSARRFLVCFLYLNDVGAGGYTNFPKIKSCNYAKAW